MKEKMKKSMKEKAMQIIRQRIKSSLFIVLIVNSCFGQLVFADVSQRIRSYQPPLESAIWSFQGSKLKCNLTQDIPKYGMASFSSTASRKPNMNFDLSLRRFHSSRVTQAILSSEPPLWKHDRKVETVGPVAMYPGDTPVNIKNQAAWNLLVQLEQGMFPTFQYDSFIGDQDQMKVSLSAVNFQPVYDEFLNCVTSLLPYSFDDIAESFVYFEFNRADFTRETRASLDRIGAWLAVDNTMELVLLAGHTDNKGKRRYNKRLGLKRAQAVKNFFVKAGLAAMKIKVQSFADIQPQSSNATPEGRAKNRRVMIKMVK